MLQDSVKTKSFTYKTNAISLYEHNEELEKLCVNNGGKYVSTVRSGKGDIMTTVSKEGRIVIDN